MTKINSKIFELINSGIHDGIIITDKDNKIIFVNSAFTHVTGYSEDEIIGADPSILSSGQQDFYFYKKMWKLLNTKGHWNGEIWDKRKNGEIYLEYLSISAVKDSEGNIENYIAIFTDINEQHKVEQQFDRADLYAALTELPKRTSTIRFLEKQLRLTRQNNKLFSVATLDLDNFKSINDRFGHDLGNRLLFIITKRLQKLIRNIDLISRFGGDEFTLVITNLNNIDEVEQMNYRVINVIAMPIEIDGKKYHITTSVGCTVFPFDDVDAEMLLRHSDQAMYNAKENGKNQCHLFDIKKDQQVQTRLELIQQLSVAIEQDELLLFYQPKVNMRTGKVIGVEALLRWQHPMKGLLGPVGFLPHIEHHDLIIQIGEWVICQALQQIRYWLKNNLHIPVSVNIAALQILKKNFIFSLEEIFKDFTDVPLELLEIEILESAALEDTEHVSNVIKQLKQKKIHFALDDFGTGYASLSYLRDIPADILKIDKSFIFKLLEDRKDLVLVEGIIGLAHAFDRTVIAEGVETTEQGVLLMRLGCDLGQGFGIAKPMPSEQILSWVENFKPDSKWSVWADTRWEMSDFPLLVAQFDHINWVKNILIYMDSSKNKLNKNILINHHECRFGHWYYGHGMQRYKHIDHFYDIEPLHILIHQYGHSIIELCDEGNMDKARVLAQELLKVKEKILENLSALQKHVVSETTLNNQ